MPEFQVRRLRDVRVPTAEVGVTLSADVWLPQTSEAVPALVSAYPYRKDLPTGSSSLARFFEAFAAAGYASVLVDLRGTGASDGLMRPVCAPGEGDDVVAAIEWAASQPWCTGAVGMWGQSYGGVTTLRAASLAPPALKAIMPMVCPADPGGEGMFPWHSRADMLQRVFWAGGLLAQQVLPPVADHTSLEAERRWRERLLDTEPYVVDLARHGARHPAWEDRVVDLSAITLPTFLVGGWRDLYASAVWRAFGALSGPRKLLMGPWGHEMPQDSAHTPIDFMPLALRWWDHWLRGVDTGVMDEPAVTVLVEGLGWKALREWPPATQVPVAVQGEGTYHPDPTLGYLGGPAGLAGRPVGQPLDPRDRDGNLVVASDPLEHAAVVCGAPEVAVRLAAPAPRVVARVAVVDGHGIARFLAGGVSAPGAPTTTHRVACDPVGWLLRAGERLEILIGDAEFPRVSPLAESVPLVVEAVDLCLPLTTAGAAGADVEFESPVPLGGMAPGAAGLQGAFTITRDVVADAIEVHIGPAFPELSTEEGDRFSMSGDVRARVARRAPEGALTTGRHVLTLRRSTGEEVVATSSVRVTQTTLWAEAEVAIDGETVHSRAWEIPL